jgi:dinuclear metal center YbgI/SA1388 family protein
MAGNQRSRDAGRSSTKRLKRGADKRKIAPGSPTLAEVAGWLEQIAPLHLAQEWDKVGLICAPARETPVGSVLVALDLTAEVRDEALSESIDLVVCYHPPLFKPLEHLRASDGTPATLAVELAQNGIWIYCPHTALDVAEGGTNDSLAEAMNLKVIDSMMQRKSERCIKLVTFVPESDVEKVASAVFDAGAGHIGFKSRYSQCSFRTPGTGTFFGDASTSPAVGKKGQLEFVREIRFETVVPVGCLDQVVAALRQAHPYEEPAFDLLTMETLDQPPGMGRIVKLDKPMSLAQLARVCKRRLGLPSVQIVGDANAIVSRAAIVAGSCGRLPLDNGPAGRFECVITGELKHQDALGFKAAGINAILLGHGSSERPVLKVLQQKLREKFPVLNVRVSCIDVSPFRQV